MKAKVLHKAFYKIKTKGLLSLVLFMESTGKQWKSELKQKKYYESFNNRF